MAGTPLRGRGALVVASAVVIALGATGLSVAAASSGPAAAQADESSASDTLTIGSLGEVDTLNPMTFLLSSSYTLQEYLWSGLTSPSRESITEQEPGLAESWDVAPDGLTVTYHLRAGLTWSDGEPLTAVDAEYTLQRVLAGGPGNGNWGNFLENVASITALDDATLQLSLGEANSTLPSLPIPILPKHVFENYPDEILDDYPVDPERIVTSGPYRLIEGDAGSSLYRFEAWPDNWRGLSPVEHVNWRFYKAQDTVAQALMKGEIDYTTTINALQYRLLEAQPNISGSQFPQLGNFNEVGFNAGSVDLTTGEPMGDPNPAVLDPAFRFALSTAFDREQIAQKAFKGGMLPLKTVVAAGFEKFQWQVPATEPSDYDPELAGQRLDEAGYTLGPDGTRLQPDGTPVGQLRIAVDPAEPSSLISANLVSEWMNDLGLQAKVETMSNEKLNDAVLTGDFDMFWWGWGYDTDPDLILIYLTCDQRGLWSDSWYCSDDYDALYAQQKAETDPVARVEIIKKMQQLLYADAPYIVMGAKMSQQAYRTDRWQGWTPALQENGTVLLEVGALYDLHPAPAGTRDSGSANPVQVATTVYGGIAGLSILGLLASWFVARRRRLMAEVTE